MEYHIPQSTPNYEPGKCRKCNGTGRYKWHGKMDGRSKEGKCFSCQGKGEQDAQRIAQNQHYNLKQGGSLC